MQERSDSRSAVRLKINIDARIFLCAPEETFTAKPFAGQISDVSPTGIGVILPKIERSLFQFLIHGKRLARVVVRLPDDDVDIRLFGQVAWIDYHGTEEPAFVRLGISLENATEKTSEDIQRLLNSSMV